ncbi:hypothetical protein [Amycolatopsis kentuckyensis]|uniref:hypothetical protein n=1 Tax=Amycolatopsis kentuckyensis TaxID=218823 RepID=UPI000A3848B9|nr:hypothetical protein [Amycolatopsis kentuckyensis]
MIHEKIIEAPKVQDAAREFDCVLIMAIAISVLAIGAVYIGFVSDETVPNAVIACMTMASMIAVVFSWGVYWAHVIRRRFAAMEARQAALEEERAIDDLLARATGPGGYIRRVK